MYTSVLFLGKGVPWLRCLRTFSIGVAPTAPGPFTSDTFPTASVNTQCLKIRHGHTIRDVQPLRHMWHMRRIQVMRVLGEAAAKTRVSEEEKRPSV